MTRQLRLVLLALVSLAALHCLPWARRPVVPPASTSCPGAAKALDAHGLQDKGYRQTEQCLSGASLLAGTENVAAVLTHASQRPLLIYAAKDASRERPAVVFGNEVIVAFVDTADPALVTQSLAAARDASPLRPVVESRIPGKNIFLIRATGTGLHAPGDVLAALSPEARAQVRSAEPNQLVTFFGNQDLLDPTLPNRQWPLRNRGPSYTSGGVLDADIDGADALYLMLHLRRPPAKAPVVAVIDSGIDPTHPALAPALWVNPDEIARNGLDDDGNGYVDDVHGVDAVSGAADIEDGDPKGHGTHVAGIIGARGTAPHFIHGVAPHSRLMTLKIQFVGLAASFPVIKAIHYAVAKHADVINMSLGTGPSALLEEAVRAADNEGIMSVAAAGNDGRNVETPPVYPCLYPGVVCVGATGADDRLAPYSNFSETRVMIAAPGTDIWSTLPHGTYGQMSGTSMAAPHVAGAFAAMKDVSPRPETKTDRMVRMFSNADRPAALQGKVVLARRLNLYRALTNWNPPDRRPELSNNEYCATKVGIPGGPMYPRSQNSPYANSAESGIDGSQANPFALCSIRQLVNIRDEDLGKSFVLQQNLYWSDLDPAERYMVGGQPRAPGQPPRPFTGSLNGNHYSVIGLELSGVNEAGLIAHLGRNGVVRNLRFREVSLRAKGRAGTVAPLSEGFVHFVEVEGTVTGGRHVGGLVGEMRGGGLLRGFFEGTVSGDTFVGGMAGRATNEVSISRAYFQGIVRGSVAGGIVGDLSGSFSLVLASHAFLEVPEGATAGGIAGKVSCSALVTNSYAEGRISAKAPVGGLVGELADARTNASYSLVMLSGGAEIGGAVGRKSDRLERHIPGQPPVFVCTGTTTPPRPSETTATFYDSVKSPSGGAAGQPKTTAELRQRGTFGADYDPSVWSFHPGFAPALTRFGRAQ